MNQGKTAFPTSGYTDGMLLRDYFAAKALEGMIAGRFTPPFIEGVSVQDACAMTAYFYADAMMKARKENANASK